MSKYYSLKKILEYNATYNVIFGERSNGKTFSVEEYGLKNFCETGEQMAMVRRWQDDFRGKRAAEMFSGIVSAGLVEKYSKGKFNCIEYYSSRWYLAKRDEETYKVTRCDVPFCYAFAISAMEHDKSTSYPNITTICFDEFLTRTSYLPNEFILFLNTVSTIVRDRNNVKIFMLGNTVNQYCPYFEEMGLKHVKNMRQGTIDLYSYGDSGLTVAVEFTASNTQGKKSDKYFAFDNPKLNMITSGTWEIDIYPHCPMKFSKKDIAFTYFIEFSNELLQCEIVEKNDTTFTYIHTKTTPIKNEDDLIFCEAHSPDFFRRRRIQNCYDDLGKLIYSYFRKEKVFYQSNEVGEIVRNYLMWAEKA